MDIGYNDSNIVFCNNLDIFNHLQDIVLSLNLKGGFFTKFTLLAQCAAAGAHPAAAKTPLCFSSLVSPDFERSFFSS